MGNNGRNSLTDDTGFLQGFLRLVWETHFNLLFSKNEKKIKILDKEFYDGKNWSWLNAFLFLAISDKRMDPFQCWVFGILNQILND